jgi:N-acetylmuramoyl-L-alanine amidase
VAAYQHRLVFDLYPAKAVDPLEALISERLRDAGPQTAQSHQPAMGSGVPPEADPLGDLIAQQQQAGARRAGQTCAGPGTCHAPSVVATAPRPRTPPPEPAPPSAGRPHGGHGPAHGPHHHRGLDPGHGGEDPGAIGPGGTREKDVVLRIAHLLRDRINASSVGGSPMRAFLTRDADFFVPLGTRVEKARRVQADLFISIHADAFTTPPPRRQRVRAEPERRLQHGRALAGQQGKPGRPGGRPERRKPGPHVQRCCWT